MLLPLLVACVNPVSHGANASDGKPDNAAITAAVEQAQKKQLDVCLDAGIWDLGPPIRRGKRIGSVVVSGGPVTIRGVGDRTVLRLTGDGNKRDWRGIQLLDAHEVRISDLSFDGLGATNTEEQTHLIEIGPGSKDIALLRVTLGPMRQPHQKAGQGIGGDCLRLLGSSDNRVEDVLVADSRMIDCDRSGVAFQRALRGIVIVRTTITGAGDSGIDFEPTGRGAIENVAIVRVAIKKPPDSQGEIAMSIVGNADWASRIVVADSTIEGGGIFLKNVHDVTLIRNEIDHGPRATSPTINLIRRGRDLRIVRNKIRRPIGAKPNPLIRASDNKGFRPHGIQVIDNELDQESSAPVIGSVSVSGMAVRQNRIKYTGTDDTVAIVLAQAVVGELDNIVVADNSIVGKAAAVLVVQSRDNNVGKIAVRDNAANQIDSSVRCNGKGFTRVALDKPGMTRHSCVAKHVVPANKND